MTTAINNFTPIIRSNQIPDSMVKAIVDQKQSLPISDLRARLEAQVLTPSAKQSVEAMTPQQLNQLLDASAFNEGESQAMMGLFLASVPKEDRDPLMSFDPSAWEKQIGVLVAAIVALNIARQASAEMSGKFTQMAYDAAKAQGVSIMEAGKASMWSAVSGAAVAGTLAAAGAGMSIKGQAQKHNDININKKGANEFDVLASGQRAALKIGPADLAAPHKTRILVGRGDNGEALTKTINLDSRHLDASSRATLESGVREAVEGAKELRLKSQLNEKTYNRNLTVGGAITSMAMITSQGLSSILRLQEHAERQKEVLHQSEQQLNKAVTDAANQGIGEDTALVGKMLDAIQQLVDSRASTLNTIASARA
jgi:hypothetical protein